jgi:hypothetical protein
MHQPDHAAAGSDRWSALHDPHPGAEREPFRFWGQTDPDRTDVKYNPVSKQYVVVANGRAYNAAGFDVALMALVNSPAAGAAAPLAKAWVHDPDTDQSYDDVAVAVSARNGNFLLAAERKFADEGEGTVGALYDQAGNRLTAPSRGSTCCSRSGTRTTRT